MPFRIQAIHLVNAAAPNLQRMLLSAVKPLLSDKLGERVSHLVEMIKVLRV